MRGIDRLKLILGKSNFKVLSLLLDSPDYTISIAEKLNLESSIITHALKKLEKAGLLETYRIKKKKYYKIKKKEKIKKIFQLVEELDNGK
tara:strand:- start:382 stop:651 length:270 start_codon:yes stop_codon:yes gene_type:complete